MIPAKNGHEGPFLRLELHTEKAAILPVLA